jgi:hypothetical protein
MANRGDNLTRWLPKDAQGRVRIDVSGALPDPEVMDNVTAARGIPRGSDGAIVASISGLVGGGTVPDASSTTKGIAKLGSSGGAATFESLDLVATKTALASTDANVAANTTAIAAKAQKLTPTDVKTAAYTAVNGDLVLVDTTSGPVTVTAPAAGPGVRFAVKHLVRGGTNVVTVQAAGSDVFNRSGGPTSIPLTLADQAKIFDGAAGLFVAASGDLTLPGLDSRYVLQSLVDAKGDLLVGTADDTLGRLPVGATGLILSADPTTASGLKWITAPSGGGSSDPRFSIVAYGADKTGAADSYSAIIAARDAASAAGGGVVYAPAGTYKTLSPITSWPNKVSLIGDGPGHTIFKPTFADESFLKNIKTAAAPMTDCTFDSFQVDGTGQTQSAGYVSSTKGLFSQFHRRCHWRNLYIHDTPATGLGVDHFQECTIDRVEVDGCGRLNGGTGPGGNGIGLGTGGFAIESIVVSHCIAKGSARYNIFVEKQTAVSQTALFTKIHHCHVEGGQYGLGDCGNSRTIWDHNTITGPTIAGFGINGGTVSTLPGYKIRIVDNEFDACPTAILYDTSGSGTANGPTGTELGQILIRRNRITGGTYAINVVLKNYDVYGLVIDDNVIEGTNKSGMWFSYNSGTKALIDSSIKRNRFRNVGMIATGTDREGIKMQVSCTNVEIDDNRMLDDTGTPTARYGLTFSGTAYTGGSVYNNEARGMATGGALFATALSATTRYGINRGFPAPPLATETPGASPWTRTASVVPETLHLSGGTVTNVTIGGTSVAASSDVAIPLEPGDAPVLTYSAAPTVSARKR